MAVLAGALTTLTLACSSASKSGPSGPRPEDDTWADGMQITESVTIAPGAAVTIAPGAHVTVAKGATITVQGKLQAASRASHARIDGDGWSGIVLDGGALDLDGVDLSNAKTALAIASGIATYQYGTIANAIPFDVEAQGQLTIAHAVVSGATAPSPIKGALTATFLDYDAGKGEGIVGQDTGATISIEDSKIHGQSTGDNDLVVTHAGAASVHVAYVDLAQAHCGFHFDAVTSFDISFVEIHDGSYGLMLYGSDASGTRTVSSTNIHKNAAMGVDEGNASTQNGPITIENGYWAGNGQSADDNLHGFTGAIKAVNMSTTTPVAGTGPRGSVP